MSNNSRAYKKGVSKMISWLKNPINVKFLNSRIKLILFIIIFAGIGVWLVWHSLAAGPLVGNIQAEQMSLPTGASVINDSYASGGQAIMLTAPGETSGQITLPSNATSYALVVKGTKCQGGRWWRKYSSTQNISFSVDGNQVLGTSVNSSRWTTYSGSINLASTNHSIKITYTNTGTSSCAQSLYLDVVNFYGKAVTVTPAPTVALTPSPPSLTAGASATITWSSTNATSCTASSAWSGSKVLSGSTTTGALNATSTYNLSCSGSGGTSTASTTITVISPIFPPLTTGTMGRFGYSVHINRMSDQSTYTNYAVNSNAKTIRDDFMWSSVESTRGSYNWSGPDKIMTTIASRNLDLLAMVGYTPQWAWVAGCTTSDKCAPANVTDYATFVTKVAQRYGPGGTFWTANPTLPYHPLTAIEIWNEPNIGFWLPTPDPAKYTSLLRAGYNAIKSVNSQIQVISAGLSPYGSYGMTTTTTMNPVTYLEKMYQNGAAGYMDAVGFHPYNYAPGRTADSMFAYHVASAWSQLNQTTPSIRSLMTQYGDSNKKIWATEIGAPTTANMANETEQANFASRSVSYWKSYSWAGNYYWYDLRDDCTDTSNTECGYGAVRYNNTFKPSFDALKTSYTQ